MGFPIRKILMHLPCFGRPPSFSGWASLQAAAGYCSLAGFGNVCWGSRIGFLRRRMQSPRNMIESP